MSWRDYRYSQEMRMENSQTGRVYSDVFVSVTAVRPHGSAPSRNPAAFLERN